MTTPNPGLTAPNRKTRDRPASRIKAGLKRVLGRVARVLPPPRDEALLLMGRSAWALIRGHRVAAPKKANGRMTMPIVDPEALDRASAALQSGAYDEAAEVLDSVLDRTPDSLPALRLKRQAQNRLGDISGMLETVSAMRGLEDDPALAAQERALLGRMIETDPRWLPRVPGPPQPGEPAEPRSVMHLLKESLPYHQNGFTLRSRYTMLCQRDAGLSPFAVTSLGYPRKDGFGDVPAADLVDGITHHRLDLGPAYALDQPHDRLLLDHAWLAARIARRERPAVIQAASGFRGFDAALVGLALREHIRRPLIYEVRSFMEAGWTADAETAESGEHYRRRFETDTRCMLAADAVVTLTETMREQILGRGVPVVHVVPNGVDTEAFAPMEPDADLRRQLRLEGRTVFGYISTLDHPREGHELLIEAAARLKHRGRRVACLIVGDGRRRAELEALARKAGVADIVRFTGRVPHGEVRRYHALIDIFVVPRRDDQAARLVSPLKPFEALSMARPLVVSDLPALVEIAAPGERGLAFRHEDSESLAGVIETLIDQPELAARLGAAGRQWVLAERTWSRTGQRYREIVDDLLERWQADDHRSPIGAPAPVGSAPVAAAAGEGALP